MSKMIEKITEKPMQLLILLLIIASVTISGCFGPKEATTPEGKVSVEEGGAGPDWCKTGMTITYTSQQGPAYLTVKGITTYEGREVCQAEMNTGQGTVTEYFNKDSSYVHLVMKDNSGKIQQQMDLDYNSTNSSR